MRQKQFLWGLSVLLLILGSCHPRRAEQRNGAAGDTLSDTRWEVTPEAKADSLRELPLPKVPSTLVEPEERTAYILEHFWDGMDFNDTLRSHNAAFLEQNFVNFLSLLPHARREALAAPVGKLLREAAEDSVAFRRISDLTELYLNEPNSPMRNEEYYLLFLQEFLRLPALPEYQRIRFTDQQQMAAKNRPGSVATDFTYTSRQGERRTLHHTYGRCLLLLFYDPACSHCEEILEGLCRSDLLNDAIDKGELAVLAIYTEGDRKLWEDTKGNLTLRWMVGIDESRIVERGLYNLPAMPVLYLMDEKKHILLKDPTPAGLESFLNEYLSRANGR